MSFHVQKKVQGCGFMYLGTNHCVDGGEGRCWVRSRWTGCRAHHRVTGTEDRTSLQSGHVLYGPHSDSPGSWALLWRVDPLVEVPSPRVPSALGVGAASCHCKHWVVSCTTLLPFLIFPPFFFFFFFFTNFFIFILFYFILYFILFFFLILHNCISLSTT